MARLIRKSKRRDRIERLENVARSGHERAAKRRIEKIFLRDFPAYELAGLAVARAVKEPLGDRIHEFIGVRERLDLVEANKPVELIYAPDVVVLEFGFNRVLPFAAPGFPDSLERGRTNVEAQFTRDPAYRIIHYRSVKNLRAITCHPHGITGRCPKPRSPAQRQDDSRRKFRALDCPSGNNPGHDSRPIR